MEAITRKTAINHLCDIAHAVTTSCQTGIGFGEETAVGLCERIAEVMRFIVDNTEDAEDEQTELVDLGNGVWQRRVRA